MKKITTKPDHERATHIQEQFRRLAEDGQDARAEIRKATGLDLPDEDFTDGSWQQRPVPNPGFCYHPDKCRKAGRCTRSIACNE